MLVARGVSAGTREGIYPPRGGLDKTLQSSQGAVHKVCHAPRGEGSEKV